MSLAKKLLTTFGSAVELPNSMDLGGDGDFLSRASDFSGNSDSKTFTLSFWLYRSNTGNNFVIGLGDGVNNKFLISANSSGTILVSARNSANTIILSASSSVGAAAINTFNHCILSVDLANAANRDFAINDVVDTGATWTIYTDDIIDFTANDPHIGSLTAGTSPYKGRLPNIYLDPTFRDLTIEANRRLFNQIDDEKGLIPVDELPSGGIFDAFTDSDDLTLNGQGTGAWTVNGIMARSERGPNQFNGIMSFMDSATDNLTIAAFVTDGKIFTTSFSIRADTTTAEAIKVGSLDIDFSSGTLRVISAGVLDIQSTSTILVAGRTASFQIAVDMATGFTVIADGVSLAMTQNTFVDANLGLNGTVDVGRFVDGNLGEVWFDDSLVSLTENPFFDVETGKPLYLGETGELPTGSQSLIYLRIRGDDPGGNLGNGGDFTVNGGPTFTGARGGSEEWARTVDYNGTTGFHSRTGALTGVSDGKVVNCAIVIKPDSVTGTENIFTVVNTASERFTISRTTTNLLIEAWNSGGTQILSATATASLVINTEATFLFNFNLASSTNRSVVKDGTALSVSWGTFTDDTIELTATEQYIASGDAGGSLYGGNIGYFYLNFGTEINFNLEENRLLFYDAFNFPTSGGIPSAALFIEYKDSTNLGLDSSSNGNDFTDNGTIEVSSDIGS